MPTRIIREGILTSEAVNSLSDKAELFFRRLMSVVDDYGRYYAHPSLLRAACYPFKIDSVSEANVKQMIIECKSTKPFPLVLVYGNEKYIQIVNFRQQTRSDSKFPEPTEKELLIIRKANENQMRSESESESNTKAEAKAVNPSIKEVFDSWNEMKCFPVCLVLSDKRRRSLEQRLKESFFSSNWKPAMERIKKSDFCLGKNERGWKSNFDWFITPDACAKIMEGKYDNKTFAPKGWVE